MIPTDIKKEDVANFKKLLNYLKQLAEDGINPLIEKQLLLMLDHSLSFFSHLVMTDIFPEIHRLTINKRVIGENKRIRNIKYLKYPPANKVSKYGRCNYPKQSTLYASCLEFTTMHETQPQIGDLVTKSIWKVKENQALTYSPIFKNQPEGDFINPRTFEINQIYNEKLKDYPSFVRDQIDALVQFIADAFTKRIHPSNHLDYIFSAYFSNKIFNELENGTIEAIFYPSVKNTLSFENLAIKPNVFDAKYELIEVKDSVCINVPSNGEKGYGFLGLSDCKSFDYASGKILWDPNVLYQPLEHVKDLKMRFNVDISD